jgi:hypothetical protein
MEKDLGDDQVQTRDRPVGALARVRIPCHRHARRGGGHVGLPAGQNHRGRHAGRLRACPADLLNRSRPGGVFIGIDQDRDAIDHARRVLPGDDLPSISSTAISWTCRGFFLSWVSTPWTAFSSISGSHFTRSRPAAADSAFSRDEPLDMRMDVGQTLRQPTWWQPWTNGRLAQTVQPYGEERWAGRIARHLVASRKTHPVTTSGQLARLVAGSGSRCRTRKQKIHPATRVFMALRIAVNRELEVLDRFLEPPWICSNRAAAVCAELPFPGRPDCQASFPGHGAIRAPVRRHFPSAPAVVDRRCGC